MKMYDVVRKNQKKEPPKKRNVDVAEFAGKAKTSRAVGRQRDVFPFEREREPVEALPFRQKALRLGIFFGIGSFIVGVYLLGVQFVHASVIVRERQVPFNLEKTSFDVPNEAVSGGAGHLSFQVAAVPAQVTMKIYSQPEDSTDAVAATLETKLRNKLQQQTVAMIDEANDANARRSDAVLISYPGLQRIIIDSAGVQSTPVVGSTVETEVSLKGVMVSYLFPKALFEQKIASYAASDKSVPVTIPNIADLSVESPDLPDTTADAAPERITLAVSGQGTLVSTVPVVRIRQALLGASRSDVPALLRAIPGVESAQFMLYPFWSPYFPASMNAITVSVAAI